MATKRLFVGFTVAAALALSFTVVTPLRAAAVQALAIVTCASTSACTGGNNTSTGPGVQGTSAKGKGVVGQTKFNSTTSANGQNGILGQDLSTAGTFNTGVTGTSTRGTGVKGLSSGNGVIGQSTTTNGVVGTTAAGCCSERAGVLGQYLGSSCCSSGVIGQTSGGTAGVVGQALTSSGSYGVWGLVTDSSAGVYGQSGSTTGVNGTSNTGIGVYGHSNTSGGVFGESAGSGAAVEGQGTSGFGVSASNDSNSQPALFVKSYASNIAVGQPVIEAVNGNNTHILSLDQGGNMIVTGTVTANGTPLSVTRTSTGPKVVTYVARQSQPTAEDVGEAQLHNGTALVHLDSGFAGVMDHHASYLVFITPQGNTDSFLYVTNKTTAGFEVRESHFGHDNVAFDYRIVAKPYDTSAPRLPLYKPAQSMVNNGSARARGRPARVKLKRFNVAPALR